MDEWKVVLHGLLIDGTGAKPVPDSAVLIRGKHIEAVGRANEVNVPAGAEVIDATGKTVLPGLIEGHAHVGGDAQAQRILRLSLQRGITTVCNVSANLPGIALRDAIESGDVRGCARLVAGCVVCPTHGHVKGRTADGPWEVRKAVREMVQAGSDFIMTAASGSFWARDKPRAAPNYTPEELTALVDEAHAWGVPVAVHGHTQPGLSYCIAAGADLIHQGVFMDEAAVRGIQAAGLYYAPSLRITSDRNIAAWSSRPGMAREIRQAQPSHRAGVKRAHELGVKIAFGCYYPGSPPDWAIGDGTLWELQELVRVGLSPMEALVAATQTTAAAYGKGRDLGTVEPGKKAELLIVSGDPLADIGLLYDPRNINVVIKDGCVEATDEAHRLYGVD